VASDDKQQAIEKAIESLRELTPIQAKVVTRIIDKFSEEQEGEHLRDDFLSREAFEYFSMRLASHHASSKVPLKKENFEHILESSFRDAGQQASLSSSMVHRGADLAVDGVQFSLKTEASKGLNPRAITISKLMEARWIRDLSGRQDIPGKIQERILSHFEEYDRIFILRSYGNGAHVRYDLHEIPKSVLAEMSKLKPSDFGEITDSGGTSAKVEFNGQPAFTLRLDGSVEKITISGLKVEYCPLHAWWRLKRSV